MKFKYAYAIAPGVSINGQESRDKNTINIVKENGAEVISLANAGGMAEAAAALLAERFDVLFTSDEDSTRSEIRECMKERSDIDCGLMLVAVKGSQYLIGHMGGGVIARMNGSCSILSKPASERHDAPSLRIYKGELQESDGFMLLSDGACQSLVENGTGSLSSACCTFFEWLREYDEDTVSEALAENINKYFIKNTKGDISVAVMVSDESDEEQRPVPVASKGRSRKLLKFLIAAIVVLAAIFVCTLIPPDRQGKKEEEKEQAKPPVTSSASDEPTVTFSVDNPESFGAGEYQVGEDIPAGEYFFWTGEMLQPDSVDVNDFTCLSDELYCMTILVKDGDTLFSSVRFTAAENVNPVEAANGILIRGKYKIGKDIEPGTYTVKPAVKDTEGRYYSLFEDEISNDTVVRGETTVKVPEEGYVVFYDSVLVVEEE